MDLEHERRLSETEARSKANEKNIVDLRSQIDAVNRLATAVEVMATKQDTMSESMDRLAAKVETLEAEPAQKWRFVVEKAIYFIVAAVIGFVLAQLGL
jgi:prefoldin subunit 5